MKSLALDRKVCSILGAVTVSALLTACTNNGATPGATFEGPGSVGAFLQSYLDAKGGPPSISVAVARDGVVVLAAARGWADEAAGRKATPETVYRTYSISKAVTAVAVTRLIESGAIALDDDIRDFVPAFPAHEPPIRLLHLLTHTSGIRHYREDAGEISSQVEYPTLEASLGVFANDPLEFPPGTGYRYSSYGFNLLTGAVEHATNRTFGDALAELVFTPAGMTASSLATAAGGPPELALATEPSILPWVRHKAVRELPNLSGRYGASGVLSTPTDLVRMCAALLDGRLLRPESLELMLTPPLPDVAPEQALGWNVTTDDEGRTVAYRSGAGIGYAGLLELYPDRRLAAAVLVNQAEFPARVDLLAKLLAYYLDHPVPATPTP